MKRCCITSSCVYERRLENGLRTKVSHRRKTETTKQLPLVSTRPFFCPFSYVPRHITSSASSLWYTFRWLRGAGALVKNSSFWWLKARITNFTNSRFHLSLSSFRAGIFTNKIFMFLGWRWRTSISHSSSVSLSRSIACLPFSLSLVRAFLIFVPTLTFFEGLK